MVKDLKNIIKGHDMTKRLGVRGRNADIAVSKKVLGWEPRVTLEKGFERTYRWIHDQLVQAERIK